MKRLSILILTLGLSFQAKADSPISISDNAVWDGVKWLFSFLDKDGVARAQAGHIEIDAAYGRQMGYYDDAQVYDHITIKNGYQSAPYSTLNGVPTINHLVHDKRFAYYDVIVHEYNPDTGRLTNPQRWVGESFWEPKAYLYDEKWYVAIGTTKQWKASYRVFSNYRNSTGDQKLRYPGNYTVTVHYRLADLSYSKQGLSSVWRDKTETKKVSLSAIQSDNRRVYLLQPNTEMISARATGVHTREWDAHFYPIGPTNPYVGEQYSVEWRIKETDQE